jgi:hypothetical protein
VSSSEETPIPRSRGAGRPSIVARYAPQVAQWLSEDPDLSGAEILRRVQRAGYRGGQSALYELVRRLRVRRPGNRAKALNVTEVTVATTGSHGSLQIRELTR